MGFPWQESWSGLLYPSPGDLPNPGIEPTSPELVGRFLIAEPPGKPCKWYCFYPKVLTGREAFMVVLPLSLCSAPVMAPCVSCGPRIFLSTSSVTTVQLLHPGEGRATVLTYPVLTPANPLPYFLPRRWSPAHSSTQVNLPAREGASQGVESPHSFLLHSFLSGAQILSQFLFSFCPTWFFGGFLALLEVWGLLLAFSGCSAWTVPLVDVL